MFGGDFEGGEEVTPEGKVKKLVVALLTEFNIVNAKDAGRENKGDGWYFCPGQNGYGVKGIPDFVGHYKGAFFSIETKAPDKEPNGFQALQIEEISKTGGAVFVVDGPEGVEEVRKFFLEIERHDRSKRNNT